MTTLRALSIMLLTAACTIGCSEDHANAKASARAGDASMQPATTAHDAQSPAANTSDASRPSVPRPDAGVARHDAGASTGTGGSTAAQGCAAPGLSWKTASKTNYTSYPDPGSDECIKYSGCEYEGMFAACDDTKPESWVESHAIVAAFPDFDALRLHDLCLRSGSKTIVVTVLDTCGDSDCDGCCTENKGSADELIDVESYTDVRWGVPDGPIEWADLGPTRGGGCE